MVHPSAADVRVLHVIDRLTDHGGAEVSLELMLVRTQGHGVDNVVVPLSEGSADAAARLRDAGVLVRPPVGRHGLRRTAALRSEVVRARPDVVHTSLFASDLHGRLAARSAGRPTLVSLVNAQYSDEAFAAAPSPRRLEVVRRIDLLLGRWATTRFHALTEAVAAHAAERLAVPEQRIVVIPRGRSSAPLPEAAAVRRRVRAELGVAPEAPLLLNVARQEPQKGQHHLVRALEVVRRRHPSALLVVAGREGSATARLRGDAAGLGDAVRFLGARADVAHLLAAADVFVFGSEWEGQGGSVVEAMAAGVPVVAFDIPPVREVLGGLGRLAPVGDPVALAQEVVADLDDQKGARERAHLARARFEQHYDIESVVPRMVDLYRTVAGR